MSDRRQEIRSTLIESAGKDAAVQIAHDAYQAGKEGAKFESFVSGRLARAGRRGWAAYGLDSRNALSYLTKYYEMGQRDTHGTRIEIAPEDERGYRGY